jgi:MFS superfamily sulfate permease-like transporter
MSAPWQNKEELRRPLWLPCATWLRMHQLAWLPKDLGAGLVLTTMLAPVGIACAVASGLGGVYGLYATIAALLAYAAFGPSRTLVLGPDSSLAAIILGVVTPLAAAEPERAIALASALAIASGVICVAAGIGRLGFITDLLSKPIPYGYMNGIALTILVSQLPKLIGVRIADSGPLHDLWSIFMEVSSSRINVVEFGLGAGALAAILLIRMFKGVPGILFAIVAATLLTQFLDLHARADVSVLGPYQPGSPVSQCRRSASRICPQLRSAAWRSRSSPLRTRACFPASMRPAWASGHVRTRK